MRDGEPARESNPARSRACSRSTSTSREARAWLCQRMRTKVRNGSRFCEVRLLPATPGFAIKLALLLSYQLPLLPPVRLRVILVFLALWYRVGRFDPGPYASE